MPQASPAELARFYERSYGKRGEQGMLYARWRTLGAAGKADHVIELCSRAAVTPASTLDVGCGDGALLGELGRRGFGGSLHGLEITQAAVDIAAGRAEIDSVELYDGVKLPVREEPYELGILSHVLEHVPEPVALLRETAGACRAVVAEVPLEDNISARRATKREHAQEVGHLQRLSRQSMRAIVEEAGLRVVGEVEDPLPLRAQAFFARGVLARARSLAKWAVRRTLHRLAPSLARGLFTVHYACLCLPASDRGPRPPSSATLP